MAAITTLCSELEMISPVQGAKRGRAELSEGDQEVQPAVPLPPDVAVRLSKPAQEAITLVVNSRMGGTVAQPGSANATKDKGEKAPPAPRKCKTCKNWGEPVMVQQGHIASSKSCPFINVTQFSISTPFQVQPLPNQKSINVPEECWPHQKHVNVSFPLPTDKGCVSRGYWVAVQPCTRLYRPHEIPPKGDYRLQDVDYSFHPC